MAALLLLVIAAPALACTPPLRFDIALTLQPVVDGGAALVPGATGELVFQVKQASGTLFPRAFNIIHVPIDPDAPDGPPLRLFTGADATCEVSEREGSYLGSTGSYHLVSAAHDDEAASPRNCRVNFEILPGASPGSSLTFSAWPVDFCATDPDRSNNDADLVFGVQPVQTVPFSPPAWALLILALLLATRRRLTTGAH